MVRKAFTGGSMLRSVEGGITISIVLSFIHSFIHSGQFYSAPSSPILPRGAPDCSTDTLSEFHAEAHRQLQVKDLPKVPTWRLELYSRNWPESGIRAPMPHIMVLLQWFRQNGDPLHSGLCQSLDNKCRLTVGLIVIVISRFLKRYSKNKHTGH